MRSGAPWSRAALVVDNDFAVSAVRQSPMHFTVKVKAYLADASVAHCHMTTMWVRTPEAEIDDQTMSVACQPGVATAKTNDFHIVATEEIVVVTPINARRVVFED